ncbi:SDR family NAD(P)-dependent oxidoreductase [Corynebacterium lizhenjunii]|uniref:SDR family NAD(P)-dependent oxidoreductase n=1 Tax=Corynebacterium lizhenjunii TaxID=2709394 RepID=A0A7T0KG87_9CORY|nr:SDR family NAD(P)-dependent oxidoreductase [Corynebacterium lizhenjunii]QPK79841.1 SDR family NAD(P)-dependent oxidoreductase [Corynebacterium lizhenjunii]
MDLHNTSAIVTGAASGLGAATALALAERGVAVTGFDLRAGATHDNIEYVEVDVTDAQAVRAAVAQAAERAPLRIAVNCAGICPSARIMGRKGPHDPQVFATTINVNLLGTFHVLTSAAEAMSQLEPADADGQRGVIINTASVAAFEGQVGQAAYAASKGAVHALSITAARDLASLGIRVNAIAPGVVATPMMEQITPEFRAQLEATVQFPPRLAKPEEFAHLALSIIDNGYLNGETIRLDGALRMPPR